MPARRLCNDANFRVRAQGVAAARPRWESTPDLANTIGYSLYPGSARAGLARSPVLDMCGVASPFCVAAVWPGSVVRRVAYTVQPRHRLARRQSQQLSLAEVQQLAAFVVRGRSMTGF